MAESSWPSPSNGRVVDDAQYEKLGLSFGPNAGVVGDFTSPQLVYGDSTGMQVKVAADRYALVRGHEWWSGASIFTKSIGANSSGSTRTDLVVLRLSRTTWDVTCVVVAGTPGAGAPAATQNAGTTGSWDLPLATVTVVNNASTISAANVTYVGAHLTTDGAGYRVPSVAALAYVPDKYAGMQAVLSDGTAYRYESSVWVDPLGWITYSPVLYHNLTGSRATLSSTINVAKYLKRGKMVTVHTELTMNANGTASTGCSVSLPVNAASRWYAIGSGGVYGSGSPSNQSGVMSIASPLDSMQPTTFTNGFVDAVNGCVLRATGTYESAT